MASTSTSTSTSTIVHIVHFGYKPSASGADKANLAREFLSLAENCRRPTAAASASSSSSSSSEGRGERYILSITGGSNNSPEGMSHGLEHSFVIRFRNIKDRDYYLDEDPVHAEFKKLAGKSVDKATVLDFEEGVFTDERAG